ncbi:MAG: cytochrome c oxidase subunit 3 [Candidatus Pseudobacter hemicellulosilyticus]|uniref:Cytochrome c oxidase subunit 3 n=1 Tax=Candidatus Pseudobacter hemicellulosilyticus TaxID=3121375 RepID=A0AAJ5WUB9_9BACT|nr:MAG: cytochrome c oxidase subunit 3 [Pseudobacter sp.]
MVSSQRQKIHPHKFTLWIAIGSIIMMFAGLTSAYIVKGSLPGWYNIEMPQLFYYSTGVMLLSSLTMQLSLKAFKEKQMHQYRRLLIVTAVLGIAFIAMQIIGFSKLAASGISLSGGSGAGQFLYIIFGLHILHVLGGAIALLVIFFRAFSARVRNYNPVPVEVASIYWHFVDLLWIYLFIFFLLKL